MLFDAYWSAAMTSTGATLATASHVIHPIKKLANAPNA